MNSLRGEMNKLRGDTYRGFDLLRRHIDALRARWGLMSEEAFREELKRVIEEELGLEIKRWAYSMKRGLFTVIPAKSKWMWLLGSKIIRDKLAQATLPNILKTLKEFFFFMKFPKMKFDCSRILENGEGKSIKTYSGFNFFKMISEISPYYDLYFGEGTWL